MINRIFWTLLALEAGAMVVLAFTRSGLRAKAGGLKDR
jgi:hypothetical protein